MKNIAALIVSYNSENPYVKSVIDELNKVADVILFTTKKHNYQVYDTIYLPESIGRDLVYEPRKWVVNNIDKWEYFLYNEDDIFIPVESVNNVIHLYETLPGNFIPGFIRYETKAAKTSTEAERLSQKALAPNFIYCVFFALIFISHSLQ
jgi:hypothetical protein